MVDDTQDTPNYECDKDGCVCSIVPHSHPIVHPHFNDALSKKHPILPDVLQQNFDCFTLADACPHQMVH